MRNPYFNDVAFRVANKLKRDLRKEGSPVNTEKAAFLWHVLSGSGLPVLLAKKIYNLAGYVAFEGFPLKRLTK